MIRLRRSLQRSTTRLLGGVALGAICLALILAHTGPGVGHMSAGDHGDMSQLAASVCLAVVEGGLMLFVVTGGIALLRRRTPSRLISSARISSTLTAHRLLAPY